MVLGLKFLKQAGAMNDFENQPDRTLIDAMRDGLGGSIVKMIG